MWRPATKTTSLFVLLSVGLVVAVMVITQRGVFINASPRHYCNCVEHRDQKPSESRPGAKNLRRLFDDVNTYVIFIGHARSGHSIVGSLLDAHPEVIVSHEHPTKWSLFKKGARKKPGWDQKMLSFYYKILQASRAQATFGLRANKPIRNGGSNHSYNYHVHGQWQGQFRDQITVSNPFKLCSFIS